MARRSGGSHKCVEEKRRMLPIYQHYTLSPGRTKSHHPEAKCVHCLKEFVCGSKQRLIRHLRKCNSITNPEQIIAETLNTLARNSATGQLNHSILEASNLLPSQISHIHHSTNQQFVGHVIHPQQQQQQQPQYHHPSHHLHPNNNHSTLTSSSTTLTTANSNLPSNNSSANNSSNDSNVNGVINHNTSGSGLANSDSMIVATTNNSGSASASTTFNGIIPVKKTRRGRRPSNQHGTGSGIHVTTGLDGKTHFTPISQLPPGVVSSSPQLITPLHNGGTRVSNAYATYQATSGGGGVSSAVGPASAAASMSVVPTGAALNSGHHMHHQHLVPFKLNSEPIDKAYLKLVLTRNLPLSLCDTKEFQNWVKTLANDYKPPSSINLIAQNLKQEAQSARQRVSNILVKAPKKTINLELHCWPDQLRGRIWYAIIAALDTRRFLISITDVIGSSTLNSANNHIGNGNATSANENHKILNDFIDDCIKRVGSDRVNSLLFTGKIISELAIVTLARQALYSNHPSIVTYYCWWHFTNLLCSDIIGLDRNFLNVLKDSNTLVNFINKRPQLSMKLEKFNPFASSNSTLILRRADPRWYSHLVCYMLEFVKNNHEAILKALDEYYPLAEISDTLSIVSDKNNNSSGNIQHNSNNSNTNDNLTSTQQQKQRDQLLQSDLNQSEMVEFRSIVMSADFWTNLNSALVYLKPFRDIVALILPSHSTSSETSDHQQSPQSTPAISITPSNNLSLSDYMHWFLSYGKTLIESWTQSPDEYKYNLIGQYIRRFNASLSKIKLLFAAYLLNPKYRCAYVTQKAKDIAIEEILNIASEFMPEESDGHTIFDQWKLYLVREEPYDMVYDESRSSALEWWMSLPCAESIRRVALRILRLKAFSSPRPEFLFSQLYFYEDETKTSLDRTTFEDLAILRYFYDHEDRPVNSSFLPLAANSNSLIVASVNSLNDRNRIGQAHNEQLHQANESTKYLPSGDLDSFSGVASDEHYGSDSLSINESGELKIFTDVSDTYIDSTRIVPHLGSNLSLESLPGFDQFSMFVDYNEAGIRVIVEEPIEKKRRKWTAQEILSKCQSNHSSNNNSGAVNNHNASSVIEKIGDK